MATVVNRSQPGGAAARLLLSKAGLLLSESHSLSYAMVMALASTPREAFSCKEIDALCQVAYELHDKLGAALAFFPDKASSLDS